MGLMRRFAIFHPSIYANRYVRMLQYNSLKIFFIFTLRFCRFRYYIHAEQERKRKQAPPCIAVLLDESKQAKP